MVQEKLATYITTTERDSKGEGASMHRFLLYILKPPDLRIFVHGSQAKKAIGEIDITHSGIVINSVNKSDRKEKLESFSFYPNPVILTVSNGNDIESFHDEPLPFTAESAVNSVQGRFSCPVLYH